MAYPVGVSLWWLGIDEFRRIGNNILVLNPLVVREGGECEYLDTSVAFWGHIWLCLSVLVNCVA